MIPQQKGHSGKEWPFVSSLAVPRKTLDGLRKWRPTRVSLPQVLPRIIAVLERPNSNLSNVLRSSLPFTASVEFLSGSRLATVNVRVVAPASRLVCLPCLALPGHAQGHALTCPDQTLTALPIRDPLPDPFRIEPDQPAHLEEWNLPIPAEIRDVLLGALQHSSARSAGVRHCVIHL